MTSGDPRSSLQFDTAVPAQAAASAAATAGVTCASCQLPIADQYFDVNGQAVCASCREGIAGLAEIPQGTGVLLRAAVFGVAAAVLGAILYYGVIAITDFEIGIVAIAIGYMVGYAIRMATQGRGGRRFQVLAVVLTYWAVGLAYTPFLFQNAGEQTEEAVLTGTSVDGSETTPDATTTVMAGDGVSSGAGTGDAADIGLGYVVIVLLGISFALPVLSVTSSLPGGLISAAIIAFGMHQAWGMTGTPALQVSGPYRVGATPTAAS